MAELVQGRDGGKVILLAEGVVLLAGSGRVVNEAGAVALADLVPKDHPVLDAVLGGKFIERAVIAAALQFPALELPDDLVVGLQRVQPALDEVERFVLAVRPGALCLDLDVREVGMGGHSHVRGEGPRSGRPDEERLAGQVDQREADVEAWVGDVLVALGDDLVVGDAGAAPGAPGHDVAALVDVSLLVADLEEVPDGVVVLVRHRMIRVVPVHPVAEPDRLLGLDVREPPDALLAEIDELVDAELLDVGLGGHAEVFLDVDLDPQALTVEAVLVALLEALHGLVALEEVLVGAAPCVVNAHGVVRRDWAVHEGEALAGAVVANEVLFDDAALVPPGEQVLLHLDEIYFRRHRLEHFKFLLNLCRFVGPTGARPVMAYPFSVGARTEIYLYGGDDARAECELGPQTAF